MIKKNIYIIGIGGIGISAIARYYLAKGYKVYGSDSNNSELIKQLIEEGCNIIIGTSPQPSTLKGHQGPLWEREFDLVIYTEAVPQNNLELQKAKNLNIKVQTYPEALAEIANNKKLITIAGTHGKSTTTSLISLVLKNSNINFTSVVGTLLKEFNNKNFFHRKENNNEEYFVLEACEYKRSFLKYKPTVGIITNIEIDHLDYYKDLNDYISAYKEYIDNIKSGGFTILNGNDINCKKLLYLRNDINYIEVYENYFRHNGQDYNYPILDIKIPGNHILFDAKIAYIVGHMLGIKDNNIVKSLNDYNGVWRRMERIGKTVNNNILMSDYGHHPTEINLTLKAIKDNNIDKKILTIFQPHQYSRTFELLEDFKNCFTNTDELIIPNIYESRDTEEDKKKINPTKFIELINHPNKKNGNGLENTLKLIEQFDKNNSNSIIILMGAGDVDNLRYNISTTI